MRLFTRLCIRANPVAGAFWFMGSMRELIGGNLSPLGGARGHMSDRSRDGREEGER